MQYTDGSIATGLLLGFLFALQHQRLNPIGHQQLSLEDEGGSLIVLDRLVEQLGDSCIPFSGSLGGQVGIIHEAMISVAFSLCTGFCNQQIQFQSTVPQVVALQDKRPSIPRNNNMTLILVLTTIFLTYARYVFSLSRTLWLFL